MAGQHSAPARPSAGTPPGTVRPGRPGPFRRATTPGSALHTTVLVLVLSALAVWIALQAVPRTLYYPRVLADGPDGLQIDVRGAGFLTAAPCAAHAERLAVPLRTLAAFHVQTSCTLGGSDDTLAVLSRAPLAEPSSRTSGGDVLLYRAGNPALAAAICAQAASASASRAAPERVSCFAAGQERP